MRPSWHSRRGPPGGGHRRRFRRSLMPKLLLVLVAAGLFVNLCVGGFWRLSFLRGVHAPLERNVAHYVRGLAAEIGSPPDTAKARALAGRYALRIRYDGPAGSWESAPGPAFPAAADTARRTGPAGRIREVAGEPGILAGWHRHRYYVQAPSGSGRLTVAADFSPFSEGHGRYLALLIGLLSLVLAAVFLIIRRLLSPLKPLTAAVERIRRGEFGHQVPECGRDELGDLARSFNAMSADLKEMIRSREQLLLDVSHELRTPITRIRLALEMGPEGMAKESIRDDLGEMETMISEILETARLDSAHGRLHLEEVDLASLAAEATADADARVPGAKLVGSGAGEGPIIRADRARVRKVLANVIDNAVKYSREGSGPVEVRIEDAPDEAVVRVEDRGVGIPAEELSRIFEPFYRVDRSRARETGGYGLGLGLCKRIMEAHGGAISIRSREGEGTEVALHFPKGPKVRQSGV